MVNLSGIRLIVGVQLCDQVTAVVQNHIMNHIWLGIMVSVRQEKREAEECATQLRYYKW